MNTQEPSPPLIPWLLHPFSSLRIHQQKVLTKLEANQLFSSILCFIITANTPEYQKNFVIAAATNNPVPTLQQ